MALLLAAPAFDRRVDAERMVVLCDPAGRFSLREVADAGSIDRSYPRRTVIDVNTLFVGLPGYTGNEDIRGPLVRYERCGPYTFRLEGDAYNIYLQGESGAYPGFAAVAILRGNRRVFAARLTECDRDLPRARPCPDGYATRIDGRYVAAAKTLELTITTASNIDGDDAGRQVTVAHERIDDDLSLWRPPGD